MTELFSEGDAVLFMKIGTHANEDLAAIIARKQREIDEAGLSMWGYGGNTCHPTTMVQPFARAHAAEGRPIVLCMQPMTSRHFADPVRAEEYSVDGIIWNAVPEAINVLGSRYALCVRRLRDVDGSLPLADTRVAVGNSRGRVGTEYIKGHVDKACLEVVSHTGADSVEIGFIADVVEPYAVFLRN
jgi:hypothetical protein